MYPNEKRPCKACKLIFFIVKYANLRRSSCRCRRCLSSLKLEMEYACIVHFPDAWIARKTVGGICISIEIDTSNFANFYFSKKRTSLNSKRANTQKIWTCWDDAVVRALASHQCGPGSIPRSGVICGLSLLVLYSAPRDFLRVLRFPLSSKTSIWLDLF